MRYEQTPIWSPRDVYDSMTEYARHDEPTAKPGVSDGAELAALQSVYWAAHRMRSWGAQQNDDTLQEPVDGLDKIRQVARAICAEQDTCAGMKPVIPPPFKAAIALGSNKASGQDGPTECVLCQLSKLKRKPSVHITFHPLDRTCPGISSEAVFSFLKCSGIECSVASEYEGNDRSSISAALIIIVPLSPRIASSARLRRTIEFAMSLGKKMIPLQFQAGTGDGFKGAKEWRLDSVLGPAFAGIQAFTLYSKEQKFGWEGRVGSREVPEFAMEREDAAALLKHIEQATSGQEIVGQPTIFFSCLSMNSRKAHEIGSVSTFYGSVWADPRKIKEELQERLGNKKIWIDCENAGMLAKQGLMQGTRFAMGNSEALVLCVSDEYAASAAAMGELQHAVLCLGKPMVVAVVGSENGSSGRWEDGRAGLLLRGVPLVDFRHCESGSDMKRAIEELYERLLVVLQLPPPPPKQMIRVRVSRIAVRGDAAQGARQGRSSGFYLRFCAGDYKCKTGCIALGRGNVLDWRDRFKFDCPVDSKLTVQLFKVEPPPVKVDAEAAGKKGKNGKKQEQAKGKGSGTGGADSEEEEDASKHEWMRATALRGVEIARSIVDLHQEGGAARQETRRWWALQVGNWLTDCLDLYLQIESMNHLAARKKPILATGATQTEAERRLHSGTQTGFEETRWLAGALDDTAEREPPLPRRRVEPASPARHGVGTTSMQGSLWGRDGADGHWMASRNPRGRALGWAESTLPTVSTPRALRPPGEDLVVGPRELNPSVSPQRGRTPSRGGPGGKDARSGSPVYRQHPADVEKLFDLDSEEASGHWAEVRRSAEVLLGSSK